MNARGQYQSHAGRQGARRFPPARPPRRGPRMGRAFGRDAISSGDGPGRQLPACVRPVTGASSEKAAAKKKKKKVASAEAAACAGNGRSAGRPSEPLPPARGARPKFTEPEPGHRLRQQAHRRRRRQGDAVADDDGLRTANSCRFFGAERTTIARRHCSRGLGRAPRGSRPIRKRISTVRCGASRGPPSSGSERKTAGAQGTS
jgi:hypothetical protein